MLSKTSSTKQYSTCFNYLASYRSVGLTRSKSIQQQQKLTSVNNERAKHPFHYIFKLSCDLETMINITRNQYEYKATAPSSAFNMCQGHKNWHECEEKKKTLHLILPKVGVEEVEGG